MSKRFNVFLKVCVFFAVFAFAAAVPAAATSPAAATEATPEGDRDEAELRRVYVETTAMGVVKGLQLSGKQITPEQLTKIRDIIDGTFPKIIDRVRQGGVYDEYKKQMFDQNIRRLDKDILNAGTVQEVTPIARRQMVMLGKKYPRLLEFMGSDKELQDTMRQMFQEIAVLLK